MNERVKVQGLFEKFVGGSVRGQILAVLVGLLFLGSLAQALLFYAKSRSVAMGQIQESYKSLGVMVGNLSGYDLQFNKQGLKGTIDGMLKADPNILWAEFDDSSGKTLQSGGPLGKAPYEPFSGLPAGVTVTSQKTDKGAALLIRVPIRKAAEAATPVGEFGFDTPGKVSGPQDLGEMRMVVALSGLATLRRGYLIFGLLAILATMALGTFLSYLVTSYLTAPIYSLTSLAKRIAGGDLTAAAEVERRRDELGRLTQSFREMSGQLASMIRDIRGAFQRVEADTQAVRGQLERNLEHAGEQDNASKAVSASLQAIQNSVVEVSRQMEGLSQLAEEVSSSVLEMITSIEEIAASADGLTDQVNKAASTLSQNVAAQRQISASAVTLNRFVEETSAAMTQMGSSIRQIEQNALRTREAAENASSEAKSGVVAVERSAQSVKELQGSFGKTVEAMRLLGQRSEEVGNILSVIDEVMEQTHLLALNAAIIAAQAGEHGKSFAVVASEIRGLAEKTSLSTREIASLVSSVQAEVHKAVESVTTQTAILEESVSASSATAASFKRIEQSVAPAVQMVQEIARATVEQSRSAEGVAKSLEQVRDLAHQVGKATSEQTQSSGQILEAVNRIRSLAEEVKRATKEQSTGSAMIRDAMERLTSAVAEVLSQASTQMEAAKGGGKAVEEFARASQASVAIVREARAQMEALSTRAEETGRELARFRTEGG
jgi:methyl-accepting chemotaxis protein